ncbi:hypothetical protein OXPF_10270 [Oxobacter pfennigii]|uniref:DUF3786 domain-containing protein n=1 Tax=Oxobacter pfennigii TaxID=36849 RepID=A0A0P8X3L3_9CLOT|nr:DUF3786 domain-containing protein [Oxobacter pfennigii]KPU45380.1 hypothetical protein OXPF_10270 [Oxobacter pfennigii]
MFDYMLSNEEEGGYAPAFALSRHKLRALAIEEIVKRSLCSFDEARCTLSIKSMGQEFEVTYPHGEVYFKDNPEFKPKLDWRLLILNHFSFVKDIPLSNKWISYRELPDGNVFFLNIKNKVLDPLSKFYDSCDKEILREVLKELQFTDVSTGSNISAVQWFAPKVPILLKFWEGDEEIHSSCQILFDKSTGDNMHIEDSSGLCYIVRYIIMEHYNYLTKNKGR